VMEYTADDDATAAAIAALATRMWCWPWRTDGSSQGPASVLQSLRGERLARQAQLALQFAAQSATTDLAFLDVAACLAGIAPAWTGGPLTWLWAEQNEQRASFDAATTAAWKLLEPRLRESCA
jgi:3-hydroxyacyl-CoA dehydrogenase/enoyl-CoA hydratase/3-hydroxybutyryl-CoA epimerase